MAQVKGFYIGEALRRAWAVFKANVVLFILAIIVVALVHVVFCVLSFAALFFMQVLGIVVALVWIVVGVMVGLGMVRIALRVADGQKASVGDLFATLPVLIKGVCGTILFLLIVNIGMMLFVVPGLYWATKFSFFMFFIVDQKAGPITALKKSAEITNGAKWDVFALLLVLGVLMELGAAAFGIGLFVTFPLTLIALALVYRVLSTQTYGQVFEASPPAPDSEFYADVRVGQ